MKFNHCRHLCLKISRALRLDEIRAYSNQQKQLLWDEIFRLEYPHLYYVDLTQKLLDYKLKMLAKGKKGH